MNEQKDVIITLTVSVKNGKRKIVLSGAPKGEMPIVRAGEFADRHCLLDEVWVELQKRKPQVVKVGSAKSAKDAKAAKTDDAGGATDESEIDDQLVGKPEEQAREAEQIGLTELPIIEGDTAPIKARKHGDDEFGARSVDDDSNAPELAGTEETDG